MAIRILHGDCREVLATLPADSVHCVVTSPPYWGLRDYGTASWEGGDAGCDHVIGMDRNDSGTRVSGVGGGFPGGYRYARDICPKCGARRIDRQLGLEATPEEYVSNMVAVFREVRRVLRPDGVCFLNLGDSYASVQKGSGGATLKQKSNAGSFHSGARSLCHGVKEKDLVGIPWRVAFALQAGFSACSGCETEMRSDLWPVVNGHKVCIQCLYERRIDAKVIGTETGWYLRSDIIWAKPNPMPESVTDRPTKAHEYIFLLTKSARYFWDQDAVREPHSRNWWNESVGAEYMKPKDGRNDGGKRKGTGDPCGRNIRSVWTIATQPFSQAHFATFPPKLAETCIKAGTSERGCCPTCGAPWARVVKRTRTRNGSEVLKGAWASDTPHRIAATGVGHWRDNTTTETIGWEPGCTCSPASPVPCTVLDPFSGAGTTVLVADRLQRNGIGIELNPEYVEMASARLSDDSPMFGGGSADVLFDRFKKQNGVA